MPARKKQNRAKAKPSLKPRRRNGKAAPRNGKAAPRNGKAAPRNGKAAPRNGKSSPPRRSPPSPSRSPGIAGGGNAAGYRQHRARVALRDAAASRSGRDIAPLPAVLDPERKRRGGESLEFFCRAYRPEVFYLAWSDDHRKALDKLQRCATASDGLLAWAMFRGAGKSTLCETAVLFAALYGYQDFVEIIGGAKPLALGLLASIKTQIETNELLLADFPEVCYPVRQLEGIAQRANGQLLDGRPTHIEWTDDAIVLPFVPGSKASANRIVAEGIDCGIRGKRFARPDGKVVRPGFVILDDPQTDESARSPSQIANRQKLINGTVIGLAGPGRPISVVMPCTIIEPGDLSDRMTDRAQSPAWQGERSRLLYGWPTNTQLWEQYHKLRDDSLRAGLPPADADALYAANREAMDEGAKAGWPVRFIAGKEISAVQHAMNLFYRVGKRAFFAEYQNEPIPAESDTPAALTAEQIEQKSDGRKRGLLPRETTKLVAFIDVQKELLYYAVLAVGEGFTGHLVQYGTYPDQSREHFAKSNIRQTLMQAEKAAGFEESLARGLESLAAGLLGHEWTREDGGLAKIERCLVDAHWGESTDLVKIFCRRNAHAAVLTPSFGVYVGAASLPLTERAAKKGDRAGLNWIMPAPKPGLARHVVFDSNFFKSFLMARLALGKAAPGGFTIFGAPEEHRLLAEHLTAEYPVLTEGRGRRVTEWKWKPTRQDNDWLDCLVGCCVAASIEGIQLAQLAKPAQVVRKVKFSELQNRGTNS